MIKPRSSCATTISSILAAEKAAPRVDAARWPTSSASRSKSTSAPRSAWAPASTTGIPDSRETADHSIPYVVAAALDGRDGDAAAVRRRASARARSCARCWRRSRWYPTTSSPRAYEQAAGRAPHARPASRCAAASASPAKRAATRAISREPQERREIAEKFLGAHGGLPRRGSARRRCSSGCGCWSAGAMSPRDSGQDSSEELTTGELQWQRTATRSSTATRTSARTWKCCRNT